MKYTLIIAALLLAGCDLAEPPTDSKAMERVEPSSSIEPQSNDVENSSYTDADRSRLDCLFLKFTLAIPSSGLRWRNRLAWGDWALWET